MSGAFSAQCQSEAPKTNHPGSSHVQLVPGLAGLACPDLGKLLRPISVRPVWAQKGGKQAGMLANLSLSLCFSPSRSLSVSLSVSLPLSLHSFPHRDSSSLLLLLFLLQCQRGILSRPETSDLLCSLALSDAVSLLCPLCNCRMSRSLEGI